MKVVDPDQFLEESEVRNIAVNTIEKKNKLSACEKSFFKQKDGTIACACTKRTAPPKFNRLNYKKAYKLIEGKGGDLNNDFFFTRFKNDSRIYK